MLLFDGSKSLDFVEYVIVCLHFYIPGVCGLLFTSTVIMNMYNISQKMQSRLGRPYCNVRDHFHNAGELHTLVKQYGFPVY